MPLEIGTDIINSVGRANYCFWPEDRPATDNAVPTALVTFVILVTTLNVAMLGANGSLIAGAIYTFYLLLAFSIAGVIAFLRTGKIASSDVLVLMEAYLVVLVITMLIMAHNLFVPIAYFSQSNLPDRGELTELLIAAAYALPAAIYLYLNSRSRLAAIFTTPRADGSARIQSLDSARQELLLWSLLHYAIIVLLVWTFVFANTDQTATLSKLIPMVPS